MEKRNIWIDCDPGIDDAVELTAAAASRDRLNILGISTVAGNQTSDRITENALRLASFLGMDDVTVVRGARGPLVREPAVAAEVHGETGLGSCRLPETKKTTDGDNAVLAMAKCLLELPEGEKLTLVPTGPLTNIALLLKTVPEAADKIERIVSMGGSTIGGNASPYGEFNIWEDPEAAKIVYDAGIPTVMCGLDITTQCGLSIEQVYALAKEKDRVRRACGEMLSFYAAAPGEGENGLVVIHDAVTILYLLAPELFGGRQAEIDVNCDWGARQGETTCRSGEGGHVLLLDRVDRDGFQKLLLEKLDWF